MTQRNNTMIAFATMPTLPCRSSKSSTATSARRPTRMATVSRPTFKNIFADDASSPTAKETVYAPEVAAVATSVCEFMNREHVRDIANYVVTFGRNFNDLSQLTHVQMTALDAAGFTADIVSCDDTSHCVCAQERLEWPLGLCMNPDDVVNALKHLSLACGLPADF